MEKKQSSGLTLIELLIVIVVLGVIASISIPAIGSIVENSRLKADEESINRLNASTRLYRLNRLDSDPFLDREHSNESLIAILLEERYLSNHNPPQSNNASYHWCFDERHWFLQKDGVVQIISTEEKHFTVHSINTNTIISYDGKAGTYIVIPETINGVTITEISGAGGQGAFQSKGIETVILPNSIEIIFNNAFRNNNIKQIVFPHGLRTIGSHAFGNNNITEVNIPDSVTFVAESAFHDNPITKITIGSGVDIGGSYSFGTNRSPTHFKTVYDSPSGGAGTYIWTEGTWIKQND